jgi:ADP-heptose:LPS heptosyltransferase
MERMKPANIATLSGSDYAVATALGAFAQMIFAGRKTPMVGRGTVEQAHSALLIRPEGLGDIILTLPAIDCLRRANPQLRIAMAVRPVFAEFVRDIGIVDETIALDYPKRSTLSWSDLASVLRQMKSMRGQYDLAFDFRGDPRNAILGAWSARVVAGEATIGTNFLLSQRTQRRFDCARALQHRELAAMLVREGPSEEVPLQFSIALRGEVADRALGMTGGECGYMLIHAGASLPSKEWETERWKKLARALADAGHRIVFTGAPGEEAKLAQELAVSPGLDSSRAVNLAGKTTPSDLAGVVQSAGAVISPDTGVAHLAHAMRVPSVTIFGAESEMIYGYPGSPANLAICTELECRPCCLRRCPRTDFPMECMERVTVDAVLQAVRQAMGALPVLSKRDEAVTSAMSA